eukprot:TRINITY_DN62083_c0_g1_i2.p1 TRINITY_DN62083_c0_g1~~TRINITY_DN62083_c0_g1_i2.p1  ORF type:complete len:166 (+),score=26.35 TRINITY_DN62083_c0_g1_i2:714-1211(+)
MCFRRATAFSFSFWFKTKKQHFAHLEDSSCAGTLFSAKSEAGSWDALRVDLTQEGLRIQQEAMEPITATIANYFNEQWHSVAITYDPDDAHRMSLYYDGELVASDTGRILAEGSKNDRVLAGLANIEGGIGDSCQYYGAIDEVCMETDVVKSAQQIRQDYTPPSP